MPNCSDVVIALKKQLKEAQATADQLRKAIDVLEGLARNGARTSRAISAAGRKRIAAAQGKRWAKLRLVNRQCLCGSELAEACASRTHQRHQRCRSPVLKTGAVTGPRALPLPNLNIFRCS